jgi:hypothetical protein
MPVDIMHTSPPIFQISTANWSKDKTSSNERKKKAWQCSRQRVTAIIEVTTTVLPLAARSSGFGLGVTTAQGVVVVTPAPDDVTGAGEEPGAPLRTFFSSSSLPMPILDAASLGGTHATAIPVVSSSGRAKQLSGDAHSTTRVYFPSDPHLLIAPDMQALCWDGSEGLHVDEGVRVANLLFCEMARGMLLFEGG